MFGNKRSFVVAVVMMAVATTLGIAPSALAWGVCARGPWVYAPSVDYNRAEVAGADSACRCTNGISGYAYVTSRENGVVVHRTIAGGASVKYTDAALGSFVAIEWLGFDPDGNTTFIPLATWSGGEARPLRALGDYAEVKRPIYLWPWEGEYSKTARYRSVCVNNPKGDFKYPKSPWLYDGN